MKKITLCSLLLALSVQPQTLHGSGIPVFDAYDAENYSLASDKSQMMKMPVFENQTFNYQLNTKIESDKASRSAINQFLKSHQGLQWSSVDDFDRYHFTFKSGSYELEAHEQSKVIGFLLETHPKKVFVLGFSDDQGSATDSADLAKKRAGHVEAIVRSFDSNIEVIAVSSNTFPQDPTKGKRAEILAIN